MKSGGLSARFATAIREAGITNLADFAREVGVKPSAIYQIRDGKTRGLAAETAIGIARRTGVRVEWLVLGEGPRRATGQGSPVAPSASASTSTAATAYAVIDDALVDIGLSASASAKAHVFAAAYRLISSGTDRAVVADTVRELLQGISEK